MICDRKTKRKQRTATIEIDDEAMGRKLITVEPCSKIIARILQEVTPPPAPNNNNGRTTRGRSKKKEWQPQKSIYVCEEALVDHHADHVCKGCKKTMFDISKFGLDSTLESPSDLTHTDDDGTVKPVYLKKHLRQEASSRFLQDNTTDPRDVEADMKFNYFIFADTKKEKLHDILMSEKQNAILNTTLAAAAGAHRRLDETDKKAEDAKTEAKRAHSRLDELEDVVLQLRNNSNNNATTTTAVTPSTSSPSKRRRLHLLDAVKTPSVYGGSNQSTPVGSNRARTTTPLTMGSNRARATPLTDRKPRALFGPGEQDENACKPTVVSAYHKIHRINKAIRTFGVTDDLSKLSHLDRSAAGALDIALEDSRVDLHVGEVHRVCKIDAAYYDHVHSKSVLCMPHFFTASTLPFDEIPLQEKDCNCCITILSKRGALAKSIVGKHFTPGIEVIFPRMTQFKITLREDSRWMGRTTYNLHWEEI